MLLQKLDGKQKYPSRVICYDKLGINVITRSGHCLYGHLLTGYRFYEVQHLCQNSSISHLMRLMRMIFVYIKVIIKIWSAALMSENHGKCNMYVTKSKGYIRNMHVWCDYFSVCYHRVKWFSNHSLSQISHLKNKY